MLLWENYEFHVQLFDHKAIENLIVCDFLFTLTLMLWGFYFFTEQML